MASRKNTKVTSSEVQCKLCIVGAGITGINALFVATQYLGKNDTVVLIDRRPVAGGMWNNAYDYVRLHQPYRMFTAGNISWELDQPFEYLATKTEVRDHLQQCLDKLRAKVNLIERFEYELKDLEETDKNVRLTCQPIKGDGGGLSVLADKAIVATGLDVPQLDRLPLSSQQVVSTAPQFLDSEAGTSKPVYIIGGGKTGMDTAYSLIKRFPNRQISMISGKGTVFFNRTKYLPTGARRWWAGQLLVTTFADLSMRFDGTNEEEVFEYFRKRYTLSPGGLGEQYFFGLLSEEECNVIESGTKSIIKEYLSDVVDTENGPEVVFRSGSRMPVEPGSTFVNCTGHILRETRPYVPFLSEENRVLSIGARSVVHVLPAVSSYFLSHLFLTDKLRDVPLYEVDAEALIAKGRKVWQFTMITESFLNLLLIMDAVPFKAMDECGLDLDRWYPVPRRLAGLLDLKINKRRYIEHCRRVLDRVRSRLDVSCAPLASSASEKEAA